MKRCSRCKQVKATDQFCRKARFADGLNTWCRSCASVSRRAYYQRHRGKEIATALSWQAANPETKREIELRYRSRNAQAILERVRERERRKTTEERMRWKRANPERAREIEMRRVARKRGNGCEPVNYLTIWERDEGRCHICGEETDRSLAHFDHVVPLAAGGPHTHDNIRVAHAKCNMRKGARWPA